MRTPASGTVYEIRVDGHLGDHWARWFGRPTLHREGDGTTTLGVIVADQAELHGLLAQVRDLGLTLLSVRSSGHDNHKEELR